MELELILDSLSYQKTVSTLNEGGKKVSGGISSAGTKIRSVLLPFCHAEVVL